MKIPGIPSPGLLFVTFMAILGVWAHGYHTGAKHVRTAWRAEVAESDRKAAEERNRLNEETRAKEAAQAALTRDMETDYANRLKAADAGRDAFAVRLRNAQARLARCDLSSAAPGPGGAEGSPAGSDNGPRGPDLESAQRLRDAAVRLQETVKLCVAWANSVGR